MIKWKTPVPDVGRNDPAADVRRLARWLGEQEQEDEYSVESNLVLGGLGVAEKIFGFEGVHASYSAPDELVILSPPEAPRKFIIIGLHVQINASSGVFQVVKRKSSTDSILSTVDGSTLNHEELVGDHGSGYVTLDSDDESLVIKTVSGSADISYSGSYLDVD